MRNADSAYDRSAIAAAQAAQAIIARLKAGDTVDYEDMEALDDMAIAEVRNAVDLTEEPGTGYYAA